MVTRFRSQQTPGPTGQASNQLIGNDPVWTVNNSVLRSEAIEDEVKVGNNGFLTIDKYYYNNGEPPTVTASYNRLGRRIDYENCPVLNFQDITWNMGHIAIAGNPTTAQGVAKLLRETNPSRPLVDLPVFAAELKDLPMLMLNRSKDLGRDLARGRLSLEYGWKPLIKDILGLLNFQAELEKRVEELKRLRTSGLRRKRNLWDGSAISEDDNLAMNLQGMIVRSKRNKVTVDKVSGFVKWVPDGLPQRLLGLTSDNSKEIYAQAAQAMLGISNTIVDPSTIWEIIPFSWLLDWYGNTGDFLAASRNIVGAVPKKICLLRHIHTLQTHRIYSGGDVGFNLSTRNNDQFVIVHESKLRVPSSLTLAAHLPFLSERQVTILSDITRNGGLRRR